MCHETPLFFVSIFMFAVERPRSSGGLYNRQCSGLTMLQSNSAHPLIWLTVSRSPAKSQERLSVSELLFGPVLFSDERMNTPTEDKARSRHVGHRLQSRSTCVCGRFKTPLAPRSSQPLLCEGLWGFVLSLCLCASQILWIKLRPPAGKCREHCGEEQTSVEFKTNQSKDLKWRTVLICLPSS